MGKKGNKRKTRWRVLPIGDDGGVCSANEDDGDMERDSASPNGTYARAANGGQHRLLRGVKGRPSHQHPRHRPYYQHEPLVTAEKKTFNEEEYTKITTPRQDVLFKKGYLGRKRPTPAPDATAPANNATSPAAPADVTNGNLRPDGSAVQNGEPLDNDQCYEVIAPDEQPQIIYTNGYVDHNGIYYINGGYELYDPYSGGVTVVVGPAPHFAGPGGGPPVLAAVPCQPLPLQPLEWFNPAFVPYVPPPPLHNPNKRYSVDSQNCSPQSSESTGPPGSPQECDDVPEHAMPAYQPQGHHPAPAPPPPSYVYPGYMFGPPVYNMNGVTVQGAPPQPPPGDAAAASKRRKKKRRRRRRRGGAEDGSEESSSEEKELEEPMSITSQESSSHELESDSKQVPTVEQDAVVLAPHDTNLLPSQVDQEKTIFVCSTESTDFKPVVVSQQEPTQTYCERQEQRLHSSDTPLVNGTLHSDSSDTSCRGEVSEKVFVSSPQLSTAPPPTPPPTPVATVQESLPGIEVNGYSSDAVTERVANKDRAVERNAPKASTPSHIETLNNAANKIKSGKPLQDQKKKQETKKSHTKNACNGNVNVKQSGGKGRKDKQRNLQNGYLPNLTLKMDGNENVGRFRDQAENIPQTKLMADSLVKQSGCQQQKPLSSDCSTETYTTEGNGHGLGLSTEAAAHNQQVMQQKSVADKTEKNQPPSKPVRKDLCKPTKSSHALAAPSLRPDLAKHIDTVTVEDTIAADKMVTEQGNSVIQATFPCSLTGRFTHNREIFAIDSKKGETEESSACPVKTLEIEHVCENARLEGTDFGFEESYNTVQVQEEKCTPSAYINNFTGAINVSSTEDEREAEPPPVPPPRRKRWRTCARRQSLERAPTPGRELEASKDFSEIVSDESSLSSSTQSEESVIELLSSMPTSPDAEAKTRSSEDDDLIYARKPLGRLESPELLQTGVFAKDESSRIQMFATDIEKYADALSLTVISDAMKDAALECSKNTRPITHAVTRWLRSQSPEEVLSLPSHEHSESDIDDTDTSGGSMEDIADARLELRTGPKNVHRNPLPASSLKVSWKVKSVDFDGAGRRVAKKSGYQMKHEMKTVKDASKKKSKDSEIHNKIRDSKKLSTGNKLPKNCVFTENATKVQICVVDDDESFLSNLSECEGEWDLWDCQSIKPSSLTMPGNKVDEFSLPAESLEDRRSAMCDPTLSVAKYYSLGAAVKSTIRPEENSDTLSESHSEDEVDALHHFRKEMEGEELHHPTLASELACSYEPLPKYWAVDPVMVISEKLEESAFEMKYLPDSGVQSEESGDEVTIGSNAQRINLKANLLHHQSAVLMSHLQGDEPFPYGGICCILQ